MPPSWAAEEPVFAPALNDTFRIGDGWQRASFRRDDLPLVARVADHCQTWIHEIWQLDRLYHVCGKCTANWFSRTECSECPHCSSPEVSSTTAIPPWAGESAA